MKNMPVFERTLVLIKPDGIKRKLTGEIIKRFERKGLRIAAAKVLIPTKEQAEAHYYEHSSNPEWFEKITTALSSGPIMALVLEGELAIKCARQIIGPSGGATNHVGTIRGDLCVAPPHNLVHGADSHDAATREIKIWFEGYLPEKAKKPKKKTEASYNVIKFADADIDMAFNVSPAPEVAPGAPQDFPPPWLSSIDNTSGSVYTDSNGIYYTTVNKNGNWIAVPAGASADTETVGASNG